MSEKVVRWTPPGLRVGPYFGTIFTIFSEEKCVYEIVVILIHILMQRFHFLMICDATWDVFWLNVVIGFSIRF